LAINKIIKCLKSLKFKKIAIQLLKYKITSLPIGYKHQNPNGPFKLMIMKKISIFGKFRNKKTPKLLKMLSMTILHIKVPLLKIIISNVRVEINLSTLNYN